MKYSDCGVVLVEMVSHPRRKEAEVPIILKEARAVHSRSYLWSEICALRFTGHIYFRSSKRHPGPSGPFCHLMDFFTLPCHIARRCLEELKISSSTMFSDLGRSTHGPHAIQTNLSKVDPKLTARTWERKPRPPRLPRDCFSRTPHKFTPNSFDSKSIRKANSPLGALDSMIFKSLGYLRHVAMPH